MTLLRLRSHLRPLSWFNETNDFLTPFSNVVGLCIPHARWLYDPAGGSNPTVAWPRCSTLTTGDATPQNGSNDALEWGCLAKPATAALRAGKNATGSAATGHAYLDRSHPNP